MKGSKLIFSLIVFILVGVVVALPSFAYAETSSDVKFRVRTDGAVEKKTENTLENLKKRAIKEIDRRVESLKQLIDKINAVKRLSAEKKSSMVSGVTTEITNLIALREKINADTDVETLRTDVKSIVTSYRVYALYVPKIYIIVNAEKILETADALSQLADKLEIKDASSFQNQLKGMKESIADAKIKAQQAIDIVTPLAPEGFPANKTELQKAREQLRLAHQDLVSARHSAKEIMQGLHKTGAMKSSSDRPNSAFTPKPTRAL